MILNKYASVSSLLPTNQLVFRSISNIEEYVINSISMKLTNTTTIGNDGLVIVDHPSCKAKLGINQSAIIFNDKPCNHLTFGLTYSTGTAAETYQVDIIMDITIINNRL